VIDPTQTNNRFNTLHEQGAGIILTSDFFSKIVRAYVRNPFLQLQTIPQVLLQRFEGMNTAQSNDKREAILDAAHKRFAHYGLAKVTMDEIAADLGISKAALYYYFSAKEDVFRHVVASEQQDFAKRIEAIIDGNIGAPGKLREYFAQHLNLLGSLLDLGRASESIKPIMRELFRGFSDTEVGFLTAILGEGKKHGDFGIDAPETTALLVQHVLQGLRIRFVKTLKSDEPTGSEIEVYRGDVQQFLEILLTGISHKHNGVVKV
jgi:AcrR family transcriptional regulator